MKKIIANEIIVMLQINSVIVAPNFLTINLIIFFHA